MPKKKNAKKEDSRKETAGAQENCRNPEPPIQLACPISFCASTCSTCFATAEPTRTSTTPSETGPCSSRARRSRISHTPHGCCWNTCASRSGTFWNSAAIRGTSHRRGLRLAVRDASERESVEGFHDRVQERPARHGAVGRQSARGPLRKIAVGRRTDDLARGATSG